MNSLWLISVVFGLMSIVSAVAPLELMSFMGLFSVYRILYPFCSLFLIQLIVPQASFIVSYHQFFQPPLLTKLFIRGI
jgi:hypothetical protein